MTNTGTDWRTVDGGVTAWFDAAGLTEGAALAGRVVELAPDGLAIDVRAMGVRVRLDSDAHAGDVSRIARDLGLTANIGGLQHLSVVIESPTPSDIRPFWERVCDYTRDGDDGLIDPQRRDPALRVRPSDQARPLRNRIHVDVVRPAAMAEQADPGEASGPYGVRHADPDGNEIDLVPGDVLGSDADTADWQAVFSAMACYRVTTSAQQKELTAAAAALADDAGFPLLIDLRPGLVILDSGKDQWEHDAHGLDVDFLDLAGRLQGAAHDVGAIADPSLPRFVQLVLDAADITAVREFWTTALGYTHDRRAGVSDIHDPRRLNPVIVIQDLDAADTDRRRQRNRLHVELDVPSDLARTRLDTMIAAGGRLLDNADGLWRIADPEGNELLLTDAS